MKFVLLALLLAIGMARAEECSTIKLNCKDQMGRGSLKGPLRVCVPKGHFNEYGFKVAWSDSGKADSVKNVKYLVYVFTSGQIRADEYDPNIPLPPNTFYKCSMPGNGKSVAHRKTHKASKARRAMHSKQRKYRS